MGLGAYFLKMRSLLSKTIEEPPPAADSAIQRSDSPHGMNRM